MATDQEQFADSVVGPLEKEKKKRVIGAKRKQYLRGRRSKSKSKNPIPQGVELDPGPGTTSQLCCWSLCSQIHIVN